MLCSDTEKKIKECRPHKSVLCTETIETFEQWRNQFKFSNCICFDADI